MNAYNTKESIKRAIDNIWYQGSITMTGDALMGLVNDVFKTQYGMRDDAAIPKVYISGDLFEVCLFSVSNAYFPYSQVDCKILLYFYTPN